MDEKGDSFKRYILVVTEQSWGCTLQNRKQWPENLPARPVGVASGVESACGSCWGAGGGQRKIRTAVIA